MSDTIIAAVITGIAAVIDALITAVSHHNRKISFGFNLDLYNVSGSAYKIVAVITNCSNKHIANIELYCNKIYIGGIGSLNKGEKDCVILADAVKTPIKYGLASDLWFAPDYKTGDLEFTVKAGKTEQSFTRSISDFLYKASKGLKVTY